MVNIGERMTALGIPDIGEKVWILEKIEGKPEFHTYSGEVYKVTVFTNKCVKVYIHDSEHPNKDVTRVVSICDHYRNTDPNSNRLLFGSLEEAADYAVQYVKELKRNENIK